MDTMSAFLRGQMSRDNEPKVFDWVKAAQIIKERNAKQASAGLDGDWEWTGGSILNEGLPVPREQTYTYLASTWATPQLEVDGDVIDCYKMMSETTWDSDTYWPEEALSVLQTDK